MNYSIFKIEATDDPFKLHVSMLAATEISFDITTTKHDYSLVVRDICTVAPHMMELDADLAEAYDNFFRTKPKLENKKAVSEFLTKYNGRITPDHLAEMFS